MGLHIFNFHILFLRPGLRDPNDIANKKEKDLLDQLDLQKSISEEFLNKVLDEISTVTVPTIDSFVQLTEDSTDMNIKWSNGVEISAEEFECQVIKPGAKQFRK